MNTRHQVTVEFEHNFGEYESPEDFVEACLNGNQASSYAWGIDILEAEIVDDDPRTKS